MRKQNIESQKKEKKDKAVKKLLKKMAYDREKHEKQEKTTNDVRKLKYFLNRTNISGEKVALVDTYICLTENFSGQRANTDFRAYGLPAWHV